MEESNKQTMDNSTPVIEPETLEENSLASSGEGEIQVNLTSDEEEEEQEEMDEYEEEDDEEDEEEEEEEEEEESELFEADKDDYVDDASDTASVGPSGPARPVYQALGREHRDSHEGKKGRHKRHSSLTGHPQLPKMHHQTMKAKAAAGFGEIHQPTTNPIYSKMDLQRLVSTLGSAGEMPPIPIILQEGALGTEEKFQEFEKIYGRIMSINDRVREKEKERLELEQQQNLEETPRQSETMPFESNILKTLVKTHLYRLVLVGSHKEDQDKLSEWTEYVVEDVNTHSFGEGVTGVLLTYPSHFVHVLEGSEDTLNRLLRVLANQFEPTGYDWKLEYHLGQNPTVRENVIFKSVKAVVIGMFQIKNRIIVNGWKSEKAGSGELLKMMKAEVPPGDFRERLYQFTRQCIIVTITLYKLTPVDSSHKRPHPPGGQNNAATTAPVGKGKDKVRKAQQQHVPRPSAGPGTRSKKGSVAAEQNRGTTADEKMRLEDLKRKREESIAQLVPKPAMIDYIIRKDPRRKIQLRTVREHLDHFWKIPTVIFSQQTDWPITSKIAPYN